MVGCLTTRWRTQPPAAVRCLDGSRSGGARLNFRGVVFRDSTRWRETGSRPCRRCRPRSRRPSSRSCTVPALPALRRTGWRRWDAPHGAGLRLDGVRQGWRPSRPAHAAAKPLTAMTTTTSPAAPRPLRPRSIPEMTMFRTTTYSPLPSILLATTSRVPTVPSFALTTTSQPRCGRHSSRGKGKVPGTPWPSPHFAPLIPHGERRADSRACFAPPPQSVPAPQPGWIAPATLQGRPFRSRFPTNDDNAPALPPLHLDSTARRTTSRMHARIAPTPATPPSRARFPSLNHRRFWPKVGRGHAAAAPSSSRTPTKTPLSSTRPPAATAPASSQNPKKLSRPKVGQGMLRDCLLWPEPPRMPAKADRAPCSAPSAAAALLRPPKPRALSGRRWIALPGRRIPHIAAAQSSVESIRSLWRSPLATTVDSLRSRDDSLVQLQLTVPSPPCPPHFANEQPFRICEWKWKKDRDRHERAHETSFASPAECPQPTRTTLRAGGRSRDKPSHLKRRQHRQPRRCRPRPWPRPPRHRLPSTVARASSLSAMASPSLPTPASAMTLPSSLNLGPWPRQSRPRPWPRPPP